MLNVISLPFKLDVLNHTPSVHVNTTVHAAPLFTYVKLGVHHVHTGTLLSILLTVILHSHVFPAASCTYIVLLPFAVSVHVVNVVVILLYHVQLYLSLFVSVTVAVNVTFPFVCVHAAGLCAILHVGFVVSNVILSLASFVPFHNASLYCTYTVLLPSHAAHPLPFVKFQLLLVPYVSHALHVLLLQLKRICHIHAHPSVALNVNVTLALFVYAALLFICMLHALGAALSIFVTLALQLHTFHAASFTYAVYVPFALTVFVFVLL